MAKKDSHGTQRSKILAELVSARGDWVPLPRITACAAQYNARVYELRRLGFKIVNRTRDVDGIRHSWYRLEPRPVPPSPSKLPAPHFHESPISGPRSLFADVAPERLNYPD